MRNYSLGVAGQLLIQSFESLRFKAYQDEKGIWTCGWGHTTNVGPSTTCDRNLATQWFQQDTAAAIRGVNASLNVDVTQNQFDALCSFTFNVGVGAEAHSTLIALVNAGDLPGAEAEFPKWNHVNGVVDAGLTRRRAAELQLFMSENTPT